ncbi:MAG: tetratricopeptide repeat protein, partial [Thiobacillus sp.]|nr:tetratricopeptide repeat protein [Thiobacillus sp.]
PENVNALYNLGLLLSESDRADEAEAAFRQSLKIRPDQADVYNDLGNVLMARLRFDEAEQAYRQAIALWPGYADAHCNLAILLMEFRRMEEAWSLLQRCLHLQPDHANALNAMGNLLRQAGRLEEAEKAYRDALKIRPDSANFHGNLGNLLMELNRPAEAEAGFRQAVALEPTYAYALGQAASCARQLLAWSHAAADEASIISNIEQAAPGIPSRIIMFLPSAGAQLQLQAALLASQNKIRPFLDKPPLFSPATHPPGQRLRIGYLSADFREHPVMHLLGGVFELHDRARFKIHAYSIGRNARDRHRERVEENVEVFRDVRMMSDGDAAGLIAGDGIDILVDLTGNTTDSRLGITASRPAPIIVNWLGYPGTLGHARLADYIIGDPVATPADQAEFFSETLAQMPNCCLPNDRKRPIGRVPTRDEEGLPAGALVFSSFNQSFKLIPETFDVWCNLLRDIPGSILWMGALSAAAKDNLRREADARGVEAGRIIFAHKKQDIADHLGRLSLADLALDSFPYTSHSTGCDALWAGVPLITKIGETFASRIAASLLHTVGLPELIAATWEEYFDLAYTLATQPEKLKAVREKLAHGRLSSPLFDTVQFTHDLEALYLRMWEQYQSGRRAPILA